MVTVDTCNPTNVATSACDASWTSVASHTNGRRITRWEARIQTAAVPPMVTISSRRRIRLPPALPSMASVVGLVSTSEGYRRPLDPLPPLSRVDVMIRLPAHTHKSRPSRPNEKVGSRIGDPVRNWSVDRTEGWRPSQRYARLAAPRTTPDPGPASLLCRHVLSSPP